MARAARWHRAMLTHWNLALAAMVRFAGAVANRSGLAVWKTRNSAQSGLPRAGGVAANPVDRTRTRFRTPARISGWRYVFGNRVEVDGASKRSGHAAVPMGAEAGSIFRRRPISSVRARAPSNHSHRK